MKEYIINDKERKTCVRKTDLHAATEILTKLLKLGYGVGKVIVNGNTIIVNM